MGFHFPLMPRLFMALRSGDTGKLRAILRASAEGPVRMMIPMLSNASELTEVLTLIQTEKIKPFPVILYSSEYWEPFLDWLKDTVLDRGAIFEEDFKLLRVFDSPDEVVAAIQKWYTSQEITGRKALKR